MKKHSIIRRLAITMLSVLFIGSIFAQTPQTDDGFIPATVYIKFKEGAKLPFLQSKSRQISAKQVPVLEKSERKFPISGPVKLRRYNHNPILAKTIEVKLENPQQLAAFMEYVKNDPQVEYVERKPEYTLCSTKEATYPDDPMYAYDYQGNRSSLRWHLDLIKAQEAWGIQKGMPNIKVAVIDNAIWAKHPDLNISEENQYNVTTLENNSNPPVAINQDQICARVSSCPSYDWSHGTHCAGAIGAINNNGVGIASIGGGVTMMGVFCGKGNGLGLVAETNEAIEWAVDNGAKVLSLSWGSYTRSNTEEAFFQAIADKGVIIVAAAGNNTTDNLFYPAAYLSTISVAAVNSDKKISAFSNFGSWVDIAGPGGYLISDFGTQTFYSIFSTMFSLNQSYRLQGNTTLNGTYYDGMFGTSMACPVVAGLTALILSYDSTIQVDEMRELLRATSQVMPNVSPNKIAPGAGVVDAHAALVLASDLLETVQNLKVEKDGSKFTLTWDAPKESSKTFVGYNVYRNGVKMAEKITERTYVDNELTRGDYRFGVSAVYTDDLESLRATVIGKVGRDFIVEATAQPSNGGKIEGLGTYEEFTNATIKAIPAANFLFVSWTTGGEVVSTDATFTFTVEDNSAFIANFKPGTAIEDGMDVALRIYPNPAYDKLYLEYEGRMEEVQILNIQGQVCYQSQKTEEKQIDISALNPGIYILKIKYEGKTISRKFSKIN